MAFVRLTRDTNTIAYPKIESVLWAVVELKTNCRIGPAIIAIPTAHGRVKRIVILRLPDVASDMVTGKITNITSEEAGKVILVITTNKYIDSVYSLSKTKVELIKNSFGGFRIPAKSLHMTDGVMGVYVVRNDKAKRLRMRQRLVKEKCRK